MLRSELHWGRIVRCYSERPANLWTHLEVVLKERSRVEAVIDAAVRLTYGDLDRQSQGLARALADAGVAAGDRVAVMLPNSADAVRAVLAVLRLGAVLVAIGTRSKTAELEHILEDAEPAALIRAPEFAAEFHGVSVRPKSVFETGGAAWNAALSAPPKAPAAPVPSEDGLLAILYTSGTTGKPKGAMLTHLGAVHSCLHWREVYDLEAGDKTLFCVPWAHVSGLCGVLLPFLFLGGTLILVPDFKRRPVLELAARERATHALMVPAMYGLLLLEADLDAFDLGAWRIAAFGGAPMPQPTIARFAALFPSLKLCNAYGATETTSPATIMPPEAGAERPDSVGRPVACADILIMDEEGREVASGGEGELWIAGPMVTPGYWRNPDATEAAFAGGYWKSGDFGSVDADGFVRIADRKKDMIIRGGFKVYPAEVESVLAGLAGVAEAAVVGRPDPILGETVVAFITPGGAGVDEGAVRAWCAERLSDYKVPAEVVIEPQPLPRNVNGKIQKAPLRSRAAALAPTVRA